MVRVLKLSAVMLWAAVALAASALCAAHTSAAHPVEGQEQKTAAATGGAAAAGAGTHGLTPQERRGKAIYLRGESPSGKEITALIGEVDVPASTLTCGGCHGARGEGKTEGGVTAGNLSWTNLLKSYGHTHPSGRKHGPFDEGLFARALVEGSDPAGNELAVAMPRFKMSAPDLADLIAYLKRIETDRDPGLTETGIKVGTLLPAQGALAETGAAMRDVLAAYFDDLNGKGGIYGRRVELAVAETGPDAAATAASVRLLVEDGQVFAIVGGMSAGADKELAALTQEVEIPFIGPATLLPQTGFQTNRYIFYLLPGMSEQARALFNFSAQRQPLARARVAIVYPEGGMTAAAAADIAELCKKSGCGELRQSTYTVPAVFKDKIFLAFPSVPADVTPAGEAELRALVEKYRFPMRHTAAQLSALAAAKVLVEGLQRGGRDVSREKLVTALEGLYEYETGATPRLTFGPNRRVGASGAYIVGIDPARKDFVAVGDWVKAN
ncbi:MAG: ABC transporter substrate-binding protein [Acidobacteria bacterium]|nr:ABC transporter substrate-binding protein [Acidobacteriota bacterium]